jgi:pimeloyl-ACP methyl ester carboxylesterase
MKMSKITVNGVTSSFIETGMGDTVILLHSGGGGAAQWARVFEELGERCHLVAPDLRGYGGSDGWTDQGLPTLTQEVDVVHALARRSTGNVHLVGHSYGGSVALIAAKDCPELYDSLTLIEPANFHLLRGSGAADQILFRMIYRVAMRVTDAISAGTPENGLCAFVDYWSGKGTWENLRKEVRETLCTRAPVIAYNFFATMCDKTPFTRLTQHGLPTLFIQGEKTTPVMGRITEMLCAETPSSRVQIIPEAGHMSTITHAREVADLIMDHAARMRALARAAA